MSLSTESFTFNPFQENTYILYNDDKECLIIDPGCSDSTEEEILLNFIESHDLNPVKLINTHCHIDHVYGNAYVQKKWNLPLLIHSEEKQLLDAVPQIADLYALPAPPQVNDVEYIDDEDDILLGDEKLKILFTPGHSPGHISLYNEAGNMLISADVLFRESIGRTDLPGGNHKQLLNTIKTKLWKLPDETVVYPGHGTSTTIGYEKKNNPFIQ